MLKEKRYYVINKIKAPLQKVIEMMGSRIPEPTHENVLHPNAHLLIDIRDEFFGYENNRSKGGMERAAFNLFIAEYEHDPYYRDRFDWVIDKIINSNWKPRPIGHPTAPFWTEPCEDDRIKSVYAISGNEGIPTTEDIIDMMNRSYCP